MNSTLTENNQNEEYKPIKSKNELKKLKSDYFLQKFCDNMPKKILLEIIKYNKNIQKRLNMTINNYKEFSELYSSIEIELKLVDNKYGEFINIPDDDKEYYHIYFDNSNEEIKRNYLNENEKYYHIYLNDNKEEIKRNYLNENENVTKLKIIIDFQVKSFYELFDNCKCIEYIYFNKFYRNNINNMGFMFFEKN